MKKKFICSFLALAFLVSATHSAYADNDSLKLTGKRAMVVGKSALYGFGGGIIVGLASQVFKQNAKNIFLFGSLGMYVGIGLGIYILTAPKGSTPYEGPDTYQDFGSLEQLTKPERQRSVVKADEVQVPVYSFSF